MTASQQGVNTRHSAVRWLTMAARMARQPLTVCGGGGDAGFVQIGTILRLTRQGSPNGYGNRRFQRQRGEQFQGGLLFMQCLRYWASAQVREIMAPTGGAIGLMVKPGFGGHGNHAKRVGGQIAGPRRAARRTRVRAQNTRLGKRSVVVEGAVGTRMKPDRRAPAPICGNRTRLEFGALDAGQARRDVPAPACRGHRTRRLRENHTFSRLRDVRYGRPDCRWRGRPRCRRWRQ